MILAAGMKLGPYEIASPLGAGGMGEVYRARDTKLNREVAIKVLPPALAADAERMARFEREARVLASLNHPNIASIYGLEESAGTCALVMELVEGWTLAERIAQGSVPLDEALPIARQIAEALEYAHEKGIIHRDLKPANIKVTPEGAVKVLDFGLAKALNENPEAANFTNSPTLSLAATKSGIILGTAAYMAPEQAAGKSVDRRADIWSFGVVLYEMLTGRNAFAGESVSETLASVIKSEPDWSALPAGTPPAIARLTRRCLVKDAKERLRDIGEARISIGAYLADPKTVASEANPQSAIQIPPSKWAWVVSGVLVLALAGAFAALWHFTRPVPQPLMRFTLDLGPEGYLANGARPPAILSPDGSRIVFRGWSADGKLRLYRRSLDQEQAAPMAGTEGAIDPFFSPDGQWIGFFADGKLKKISAKGGSPEPLCDVLDERGGAWGDDGQILLGGIRTGLLQVSSAGGIPKPVTHLNTEKGEFTHSYPQILPGGQAVIFTVKSAETAHADANVDVQVLKTGQRKTLQRNAAFGRYLATGHLIYANRFTLYAAPMSLDRLEVTGPPIPVLDRVAMHNFSGCAHLSFSETGALLYLVRTGVNEGVSSLFWLDGSGKALPLRAQEPDTAYWDPSFSPDGRRLALSFNTVGFWDLYVYDWEKDQLSPLTHGPGFVRYPAWTPDGAHIAFVSNRHTGVQNIYWVRADGTGEVQRLTDSQNDQVAPAFSPDGKWLVYTEKSPGTGMDIWKLPLDTNDPDHPKPGKAEPFLRTPADEGHPVFSRDGRWLAYESNGQVEVRPFSGQEAKWPVSTDGGGYPIWSPNGRELFYLKGSDQIMVTSYRVRGATFEADKPHPWVEAGVRFNQGAGLALAPDGKRFVVIKRAENPQAGQNQTVAILLNFFDELRRRVPVGGK